MSTNLVVKPRRFRITLWSLDSNLKPVAELCEVASFQTMFALNSIPMASVEPAHGVNVKTDKINEVINKLDQMVRDKAPLGVLVARDPLPMHATISTINADDPDCKWPKEPVWVFKGYAASRAFQKSSVGISSTLHIQHWLSDLSAISLYSPRSHASNPSSFGMDMCIISGQDGDENSSIRDWGGVDDDLFNATDGGEGIFPTIKALILSIIAISEDSNPSLIGAIDPIYIEKTKAALDRFTSYVAWKPELEPDIEEIGNAIMDAIGAEVISTYANATAWQKIIEEYSAMFYYAVSPGVEDAKVIPYPSKIARECIELTENDVTQFNMSIPTAPVLGGCILTFQDGTVNEADVPRFDLSYIYPDIGMTVDTLEDSIGGPLAITSLPAWLQSNDIPDLVYRQDDLETPYEPLEILPRMGKAIDHLHEDDDAFQNIAKDLVAFDFLSQVFKDRTAQAQMPFRADMCPGACVHLYIEPVVTKEETPIDLYGTISSVDITINDSSASTTISLQNIRNKEEYESDMYNPDTCPFYKEVWSGKGVPLYSKFK